MDDQQQPQDAPTAASLPELGADAAPINPPQPPPAEDLSPVAGVPVKLTVEVGRRVISIADAAEISTGVIIQLDRQADQPLDVLVNGQVIAKGEVVIIDNEVGVRITEVVDDEPAV
jgi:flagellar motor switch protein FliN/FliY